jgi:sulfur carrier protein
VRAEIIPSEPDPVNTGEGKRRILSLFSAFLQHLLSVNPDVMAEVTINQRQFQLPERSTLADVLPLLQIAQADGIAIAVNEEVVPRGEWAGYLLDAGDRVFVIRATQGG